MVPFHASSQVGENILAMSSPLGDAQSGRIRPFAKSLPLFLLGGCPAGHCTQGQLKADSTLPAATSRQANEPTSAVTHPVLQARISHESRFRVFELTAIPECRALNKDRPVCRAYSRSALTQAVLGYRSIGSDYDRSDEMRFARIVAGVEQVWFCWAWVHIDPCGFFELNR